MTTQTLTIQGQPQPKTFNTWGAIIPPLEKGLKSTVDALYGQSHIKPLRIHSDGVEVPYEAILDILDEYYRNPNANTPLTKELQAIFEKAHNLNGWSYDQIHAFEAAQKTGLPLPSINQDEQIIYTIKDDFIPTAIDLLTDPSEQVKNTFLITTNAITDAKNVLYVTFNTNTEWKTITDVVKTQASTMDNKNKAIALAELEVPNIQQTLLLEPCYSEENFSLDLLKALSTLEKNNTVTCFPTSLESLFRPDAIIFLNLKNISDAQPSDIKSQFQKIKSAINIYRHFKMATDKMLRTAESVLPDSVKNNNINTKPSIPKDKLKQNITNTLPEKLPSKEEQLAMVYQLLEKTKTQMQSENSYKIQAKTPMKPNRRKPFDPNILGTTSKTKYHKDLHIYVDYSGSMREHHLKDIVQSIIIVAKKENRNIYVSSWGSRVSQPHKLQIKNRTLAQIYKYYSSIPKSGGGTNIHNVWASIDVIGQQLKKHNKADRINIVITDFEFNIYRDYNLDTNAESYKNTYYVPITPDDKEHEGYILDDIKTFVQDMMRLGGTKTRQKIII